MAEDLDKLFESGEDLTDEAAESLFDEGEAYVPEQPKEEPSQMEALARGAGQGITLGFSDELIGAGQALTSGSDEGSLIERYRKYRDLQRKAEEEASAAHPMTYFGGEVASGFIPGLGAIGAAKRGAGALKTLAAGAKLGGVAGAGTSTADVTKGEINPLVEDVAAGGAIGGVAGGTLAAGGKALQAGKFIGGKAAYDSGEFASDVARAFELGKKGKTILGKRGAKAAEAKVIAASKKIQDEIFEGIDKNFKEKMRLIKGKPNESINFQDLYQETIADLNARVDNMRIDPDEAEKIKAILQKKFYEKMPEKIRGGIKQRVEKGIDPISGETVFVKKSSTLKEGALGAQPDKIQRKIGEMELLGPDGKPLDIRQSEEEIIDGLKEGIMRGDMSLEQAANFVRDMQRSAAALGKSAYRNDQERASLIKRMAGKASDMIEEKAPEIKELNKRSHNLFKLIDRVSDLDIRDKKKVSESLASVVKRLDDSFAPEKRIKEKEIFDLLKKGVGSEQRNKLLTRARTASQDFMLGKRAQQGEQISAVSQIIGAFKDRMVKGANMLGSGARKLDKFTTGSSAEMTGAMKKMPSEAFEKMAKKLSDAGKDRSAQKIMDFVKANKPGMKNAIIYSIVQNPELKQDVAQMMGEMGILNEKERETLRSNIGGEEYERQD